MNNKVIDIMPDTPARVAVQCNRLANDYASDIYKIFVGFPLLFPNGEEFRPVALILSSRGIIFYTKNKNSVDNEEVFLKSRLLPFSCLRIKTELRFDIIPFLYEDSTDIYETTSQTICDYSTKEPLDVSSLRFIESALTGMLTKKNQNIIDSADNESDIVKTIKKIDYSIATFDSNQYKCIEARSNYKITAIRGLAGCGKTVVLCKIAANEIYRDPNAVVCYTYQTRSMYGQVKNRIKDFLFSSGIDDYDSAMERIDVIGAWGGYNNPGLLNKICHHLDVVPLDLEGSKMLDFSNPFMGFCKYVYSKLQGKSLELYDYVLVDEAQDLNPVFLRICLKVLKKDGKLIYAYDDFQTLSETTLPPPQSIFPKEKSLQSFPLRTCYRTPPKILSLAHALSMGIYCNPPTFYQFPANPSDWEAMGYNMEKGRGNVGEQTVLSRNGPAFYDELSSAESAIRLFTAKNGDYVFTVLAKQLYIDINNGISPDDILVIDLDGAKIETDYQSLVISASELNNHFNSDVLKTYLAGSLNPNVFRKTGFITFSGVKRAKGNEAFKVYLINAAKTMSKQFPIVWRNRLFTALTRTRLQIVIINSENDDKEAFNLLMSEMHRAKEKSFKLEFVYPSPREVKKIIETAKAEEKIMVQANSMTEKVLQIGEDVGNDKKLDVLNEVITSSLSPDEVKKLLDLLKGNE